MDGEPHNISGEPLLIAVRDYEDPENENTTAQKLNERLKRIFCNKYNFTELKEKFNEFSENFGEYITAKNKNIINEIKEIIKIIEFNWLYFNKLPAGSCYFSAYLLQTPKDEKNFAEDIARALENLNKLTA